MVFEFGKTELPHYNGGRSAALTAKAREVW
jgi:hypothetical protein